MFLIDELQIEKRLNGEKRYEVNARKVMRVAGSPVLSDYRRVGLTLAELMRQVESEGSLEKSVIEARGAEAKTFKEIAGAIVARRTQFEDDIFDEMVVWGEAKQRKVFRRSGIISGVTAVLGGIAAYIPGAYGATELAEVMNKTTALAAPLTGFLQVGIAAGSTLVGTILGGVPSIYACRKFLIRPYLERRAQEYQQLVERIQVSE